MKTYLLFTSPQCIPCKEIKENLPAQLNVEIVDIFDNISKAREYGIKSAPTLVVLSDNVLIAKYVGATQIKEFFSDLNEKKRFFRVCNPDTKQGLWYDFEGKFTGLIHDKFNFCVNSSLKMDFDDELVGWLSSVENLDDLYKWFTVEDIKRLQEHGWYIYEYEAVKYKFYNRFKHLVICKVTSVIIQKHIL